MDGATTDRGDDLGDRRGIYPGVEPLSELVPIDSVRVAAYRIPTATPESDAT